MGGVPTGYLRSPGRFLSTGGTEYGSLPFAARRARRPPARPSVTVPTLGPPATDPDRQRVPRTLAIHTSNRPLPGRRGVGISGPGRRRRRAGVPSRRVRPGSRNSAISAGPAESARPAPRRGQSPTPRIESSCLSGPPGTEPDGPDSTLSAGQQPCGRDVSPSAGPVPPRWLPLRQPSSSSPVPRPCGLPGQPSSPRPYRGPRAPARPGFP